MSTWTTHCGYDAEFNDMYLRTDGTRWQKRHQMKFEEGMSGADLVKQIQSLAIAYHDLEVEQDLPFEGPPVQYMVYWEDIPPDHPDIKFAQEELGDRMDRREKFMHQHRMKDPVYAEAFEKHMAELFKKMKAWGSIRS